MNSKLKKMFWVGVDLSTKFGANNAGLTTGIRAAAIALAIVARPAFAAQSTTLLAGAPTSSAQVTNSASTLKVKSFSALGTGAIATDTVGTTCFGEVCNASSGVCECITFAGTTKAPILGSSTWTADFTVNDNDTTPTGNGGFCYPSEGELIITSAKGDIKAEVSGPACQNFLGGASFVLQWGQAFKIDPTLSDGSALGLNGGGSFSLSDDVINGGFVSMSAIGFSAK